MCKSVWVSLFSTEDIFVHEFCGGDVAYINVELERTVAILTQGAAGRHHPSCSDVQLYHQQALLRQRGSTFNLEKNCIRTRIPKIAAIMRDAVSAMAVLGLVAVVCCLQVGKALSDETPMKTTNDNPQMEDEMSKRDWNKDLHIWGKRGWSNFQDGWGKKRNTAPNNNNDFYEKRAWQNMNSGWGKRFSPDDAYAIRQYAAMMDRAEPPFEEYGPTEDDFEDTVKRGWKNLGGEWGKRSKWDNFGPAWGKREPAWSNLKGIWGKRSVSNN